MADALTDAGIEQVADAARGHVGGGLVEPARDLTVVVPAPRAFERPEAPAIHRDIRAAAHAALV